MLGSKLQNLIDGFQGLGTIGLNIVSHFRARRNIDMTITGTRLIDLLAASNNEESS